VFRFLRLIAAAMALVAKASYSAFAKLHSLLWPQSPVAAEPSDLAADILATDGEFFSKLFGRVSDRELNDYSLGMTCKMWAREQLGRWADEPGEIDGLPLHVQAWLMSLNERQLDYLAEDIVPSAIERHVLAKDYIEHDPGLPAVVSLENARHLARRNAQPPRTPPLRTAVLETLEPVPIYAPAPRF
jgi:hypothetical protein